MFLQIALYRGDEFETATAKFLLGDARWRFKHAEFDEMNADSIDAQLLIEHVPSLAFAQDRGSGDC